MERYELLGPVGEGSYGTVLKCRHRDSGRLVAIKKFMDSDDDKTVKKIALREIKLLRQLRHDNLVNLLEVWKRRRRWYLVFEFVDRTLLDDLEQNPNGLDLNTSRQYLYQILKAATFCHQQNIIHRDIKPENILISQGGVVKLCDFGFARTVASSGEGSVYTDYVATRWYRAPELLVGDIKYGKPVDVWAIGCLLLEMLTGQPLFPGDSDLDQIYHIIRCFGNLTSHHQELFYRNPVFSGVRLPECSSRVPLQQRFPTMTPSALGLAQSCLEMDPERRAQCSDLLDHPWFTQDSFHIRFLDELNAKIQNDHRENSTFPKITKTPRPERDDGEEKNRKGKDKKQPDSVDEKKDKTKGKQHLKLSKTTRNTSESTKQPKTVSNKAIHNVVQSSIKNKGGKGSGSEVKSDSSETTKTAGSMTDSNRGATKPPEPKEDYTSSSDKTEQNATDTNKIKSKPSQECGKTSKVPQKSKSSTSDHPDESQSGVELTDTSLAPKSEPSSGEHRTPTMVSNTETCKTSKGLPKEMDVTEEDCGSLKTKMPEPLVGTSHTSDYEENPESSDPSSQHQHSTSESKISTEPRMTSTSMLNQNTSTGATKTLTVSDKENREDLALSVSMSTRTKSLLQLSESKEIRSNFKSDVKSFNAPHNKSSVGEPKTKPGSFSNHRRSTETSTQDLKASTAGLYESVYRGPHSSPPPPPPPPSSTPLLLPPSSTSLTPSFCVVNTSSPSVSDHFTLGTGFHSSIRSLDKPRHHGGISGRQAQHVPGSLTFQVSEKSLLSERSFLSDRCNLGNSSSGTLAKNKPHVYFPDLRASMLPELRGREGKHNKTKDQRKHPSSPPSEHSDTYTPKQT